MNFNALTDKELVRHVYGLGLGEDSLVQVLANRLVVLKDEITDLTEQVAEYALK